MSAPRPKENRHHKKDEDLEEVRKWCELFPWYKQLVDDVRAMLAHRTERSDNVHGFVTKDRNTQHDVA